jgi:hypothetical protein
MADSTDACVTEPILPSIGYTEDMAIGKVYKVVRDRGGEVRCQVETAVGDSYRLSHIVLHSPTGFEYGYGGSGPADLALSILCDLFEERPTSEQLNRGESVGWKLHQDFKAGVVARQKREDDWSISEVEIMDWINAVGKWPELSGGLGIGHEKTFSPRRRAEGEGPEAGLAEVVEQRRHPTPDVDQTVVL